MAARKGAAHDGSDTQGTFRQKAAQSFLMPLATRQGLAVSRRRRYVKAAGHLCREFQA